MPSQGFSSRFLAVLISGGLDSAILLGDSLRRYAAIHPIYIRCGLTWEQVELEHLRRFLAALGSSVLKPLTILEQPVADLYAEHWSLTGRGIPGAAEPDEAVFLPGRNVLLLGKALLWCHLHKAPAVALGSLMSNPFPDATPAFFQAMQNVVNLAVGGGVQILLPLAGMSKREVMLLGKELPLGLTFSCMDPQAGSHCGRCNKCAERMRAFHDAGLSDPTRYA
ncbi:MAG: 7-cyano-7-deazaguanine synthase [Planctomycetes bacterium]|nr:7-cyano-7-deazaguanine synthase [Planctomycetota bacterium]